MDIIKKFIKFLKKLFNKEDSVKMIDSPVVDTINIQKENKGKFIDSLKMKDIGDHNKKNIETLVCFGDGLGIQNKVNF